MVQDQSPPSSSFPTPAIAADTHVHLLLPAHICLPLEYLCIIIMSTAYYQYQPTGSLPVNVPGKHPQPQYQVRHNRNSSGYSHYSASPPERPESVSTSGAGLYSSASSQYAGSEYDTSSGGATSVDLLDYMNDRLSSAYNPIPLDRNLAKQAQM